MLSSAAKPPGWSLWRAPKAFVVLVLAVCLAAATSALPLSGLDVGTADRFVVLLVFAALSMLTCLRMERARQFLEGDAPDLAATWTFAAALCLDHVMAVAVVIVVYALQWSTQKKLHAGRFHRYVFSAGTVIIGVRVAQFAHNPALSAVLLVGANSVLIGAALIASGNPAGIRRMADLRAQATELVTIILGFATASLIEWHLLAGVATVPVIIGVQYVSLRRSVRQPSTIDSETGVLTARAWNALGDLRLRQVREAIVLQVLVTELGMRSLRQCAEVVRESVRPEDLIGRAADGFSVLVAEPGGSLLAQMLALQMQARLSSNGFDCYIGTAVTPDAGTSVDLQALTVTANAEVIVRAATAFV